MTAPLSDPTLRLLTICAAILTLKLIFTVILIGLIRNARGVFVSPEDYRFRGRTPGPPDELLERVRRVHQNDVENLPVFLGMGLLFALSGPSPTVAWWVFVVFTGARLLHTVFYLAALQPWRSIIYGVGSVALGLMPVDVIWRTLR